MDERWRNEEKEAESRYQGKKEGGDKKGGEKKDASGISKEA